MKKRIYTGKNLSLSFNSKVLEFNDQILTFWQRGLTHVDANSFTYTDAEMGMAQITMDIMVDKDVNLEFTRDWYVEFRGEKFYLSSLNPPVSKSTDSVKYKYSLIFKSQRDDLDRYEFADFIDAIGSYQPIRYDGTIQLTINEFIERLNINLQHYFGSSVWVAILDDAYMSNLDKDIYDGSSRVTFSFSRQSLWSILTSIYQVYGLRWLISNESGVMTIRFGKTPTVISHTFEYGYNNGLVKVERGSSGRAVYTRLSGAGSSRNLPYRYYHSSTPDYIEDPDNNEYTRNIPYSNLMPASYRRYVKGWNDFDSSLSPESTDEYYMLGYIDSSAGVFNPSDYIIDSDAELIYGVRKGSIDVNEDVFPTIQGATNVIYGRLDEVVAVEAVLNDDFGQKPAEIIANSKSLQVYRPANGNASFSLSSDFFSVLNEGSTIETSVLIDVNITGFMKYRCGYTIELRDVESDTVVDSSTFYVDLATQDQLTNYVFSDLQPMDYYVKIIGTYYPQNISADHTYSVTLSNVVTRDNSVDYKQTFDIWLKNIWGTQFRDALHPSESADDYMHRVWDPLLVPGKDLTVMFSSGLLSGEDYEFKVAKIANTDNFLIERDTTKSIGGVNSEWRLTLLKSDVNINSDKLMLPNMVQNASAGDYMFFTNIEMPYYPYVYDAENRLDLYIQKELNKLSTEDLSYTISPSGIFLESFDQSELIKTGNKIQIYDKKIIGELSTNLDIALVTIEYSSDSIVPKWTIGISDGVKQTQNSVQILAGEVKVLSSNIKSAQEISDQITRNLDSRYLKKDGDSQHSQSPTTFKSGLNSDVISSESYQQGMFGGNGYSIYKDASGSFVLEIDKLNVRKTLNISELVVRQVSIYGGIHIYSAAAMTASDVDLTNLSYDTIYLDIKNGTVLNQFVVGDYAYCKRFSPLDGNLIKYYWKEVVAVGPDYIRISKTGGDGTGVPEIGDNIAQLGNSSNIERQSALIIDQTAGGSVKQYAFINGFSLADKNFVEFGVDPVTGLAYNRTYGDWHAGGRDLDTDDFIAFDSTEGIIYFRGTIREDSRVIDQSGNQSNLIVDRGDYDPSTSYYPGNTVYYIGSTYKCIQNTNPGISPSNEDYWTPFAKKGTDGTSVKIIRSVATSTSLPDPYDGSIGDGYITQDTGNLWVYTGSGTPPWENVGQIKGDKGDPGASAAMIKLICSSKIIVKSELGEKTPSSITITGVAVNTAITSWSYAVDGGLFSTTPPSGVSRTGSTVTITPSDATFESLSVKATNGVISDSETVSVVSEGSSTIIAVLSNESQVFACDEDGNLLTGDYSDYPSTISLYRGNTQLIFEEDWYIGEWMASEGISFGMSDSTIYIWAMDGVDSGWVYVDFEVAGAGWFGSKKFYVNKVRRGKTGNPAIQLVCPDQNTSVYPAGNSFSKSIKLTLMNGDIPIPISDCSIGKSLTGLTATSDTISENDYTINLSGFNNATTAIGYINVTFIYNLVTYTKSISVSRVSTPVAIAKGAWSIGYSYSGNYIQRDVVLKDGSFYIVKPTVGSTSTTWVPSEWELLNSFKNVATDTLFANNANVAGFIFKDGVLISQQGTIYGDSSTNYAHEAFIPNLKLDGSTGNIIANDATIRGSIYSSDGSIGGFSISENKIESNGGEIRFNHVTTGVSAYNTFGSTSEDKTVQMNLGVNTYQLGNKTFSVISNRKTVFSSITDWGRMVVSNLYEILFKSPVSGDSYGRYGYQYVALGSGHMILDGIVDGAAFDEVTFSNSYQVMPIKQPFHSNRITVNSGSYANCILVLPDISTLRAAVGVGMVSSRRDKFTFKITIVNTGTNSVGIAGKNTINIGGSQVFNIEQYPLLYEYGGLKTTGSDIVVLPKRSKTFILTWDGSSYYAISEQHDN